MRLAIVLVLWISVALIIYVYIGYPLMIAWMARIWPLPTTHPEIQSDSDLPMVTVIIPAHNEEHWIERKIENTLALDYPHGRMHILVASDGSADKTVEIAKQFASRGVDVIHYPRACGQSSHNEPYGASAEGEIIFSQMPMHCSRPMPFDCSSSILAIQKWAVLAGTVCV